MKHFSTLTSVALCCGLMGCSDGSYRLGGGKAESNGFDAGFGTGGASTSTGGAPTTGGVTASGGASVTSGGAASTTGGATATGGQTSMPSDTDASTSTGGASSGSVYADGGAVYEGVSAPADAGTLSPPTGVVWSGYVENYQFDSGSDALTVTLSAMSSTAVTGHVKFGAGLVGPFTNPEAPGNGYNGLGQPPYRLAIEGFEYTVVDGTFDGSRLQFSIAETEVWQSWCALQPPIADAVNPGQYECLPNYGGVGVEGGSTCFLQNPTTGVIERVGCGAAGLCLPPPLTICVCDAHTCGLDMPARVHFDVQVSGSKMDGSEAGLTHDLSISPGDDLTSRGDVHNVHITQE